MKNKRITISTEPKVMVKLNSPMPGLLWAELLSLLNDYKKFEKGLKGTRFDNWLDSPRKKSVMEANGG